MWDECPFSYCNISTNWPDWQFLQFGYAVLLQIIYVFLNFSFKTHNTSAIRTSGASGTIILAGGSDLCRVATAHRAQVCQIKSRSYKSVPWIPRISLIAQHAGQTLLKQFPGGRNKLRRPHRPAVAGHSGNRTRDHGFQRVQTQPAGNL